MNTPAIMACWRNGRRVICPHGNNWQRTGHTAVEYSSGGEKDAFNSRAPRKSSLPNDIALGENTVLNILFDDFQDRVAIVTTTHHNRSFAVSCFPFHLFTAMKYDIP